MGIRNNAVQFTGTLFFSEQELHRAVLLPHCLQSTFSLQPGCHVSAASGLYAFHSKRKKAVKGRKWEQPDKLICSIKLSISITIQNETSPTELQPGGALEGLYSSCQQHEGLLHSLFIWNGFNSSGSIHGFTFPHCPDPIVSLKFTFN